MSQAVRSLQHILYRAARSSPDALARRLQYEARVRVERVAALPRAQRFSERTLLQEIGVPSLHALWEMLAGRPYPMAADPVSRMEYDALCPGDVERIINCADAALAHKVHLLGSGPVALGGQIDWHRDYRTGYRWPARFFRQLDLNALDSACDVKFPWELSRLQWMIPVGQAYVLTGQDRYALEAREVIDHWINQNPYAHSVAWGCAMEAAMRVFSWTWFFHVFHDSAAWKDCAFRERFLTALFLHGDFIERNFERWDVSGNHCVADAAGLAFLGLFFGTGLKPRRWLQYGVRVLVEEQERQVLPDGTDFEGSVPYHRLALELFFLPMIYGRFHDVEFPREYRDRLAAMARFVVAYLRPDGAAPVWGDADDGRALPFGGQALNDHRYLIGLVGTALADAELLEQFSGSRSEVAWTLGLGAARSLPTRDRVSEDKGSAAFPHGGYYTLRRDGDYVFIDCGPVGFSGRGGHGHNDCLSFEAVLDNSLLIVDSGSYVYTASYRDRNLFRSTVAHNTPMVDQEEINRFVRPELIWLLRNDAEPQARRWETGGLRETFEGAHSGYQRLATRVTPVRTIELFPEHHMLRIHDRLEGSGHHLCRIPLHLAPGISCTSQGMDRLDLDACGKHYAILWNSRGKWAMSRESAGISTSYGVVTPSTRLVWQHEGTLPAELVLVIAPRTALGGIDRAALWSATPVPHA